MNQVCFVFYFTFCLVKYQKQCLELLTNIVDFGLRSFSLTVCKAQTEDYQVLSRLQISCTA